MCRLMALFIVALALSTAAQADQELIRKAGEWQVTLVNKPGDSSPPQSRQTCYAKDETLSDAVANGMKQCSAKSVKTIGQQVVIDASCTVDSAPVTTHVVITQNGANAFHTESHLHFMNPPEGGQTDIDVVTDAKWLGACPAGAPAK
jgi:hypothetical protein